MTWQEEFDEINRQYEQFQLRRRGEKGRVQITLPSYGPRSSPAWFSALGIPAGLGLTLGFLMFSTLHSWVSVALPSLLIYLTLAWR